MKKTNQAKQTRMDSVTATIEDFKSGVGFETESEKVNEVIQQVPAMNTRLHNIHLMYDQFTSL